MNHEAKVLLVIILAGAVGILMRREPGDRGDSIEYRGHKFKLNKQYRDFEDYEDDENNLAVEELPRIEKAMLEATIASSFKTEEQFVLAVAGLQFPGYGASFHKQDRQSDDSTLMLVSLEIPQRSKDRYLVARTTGELWTLVDDFVFDTTDRLISRVKIERGKLRYYDRDGAMLRETNLAPASANERAR